MKFFISLAFSAFALAVLNAQTVTGSFTHDGIVRDYRLHLPPNFQPSEHLPLVFNLHGLNSNAEQQEAYSGMNAVADTARFLACYANGVNSAWNVGFAGGSTADDLGFLSALMDTLHLHYNADLSRTYSCGMSNGGFMSHRLACELSGRIAAIASVTGSMTSAALAACQPERSVPVMQVHGDADPVVPYAGGPFSAGVENVVAFWVGENACPPAADTLQIPDTNPFDQSTAQRFTWSGCGEDSEVVFVKIQNGGHTWPGAIPIPIFGATNQDFNASAEIWRFFNRFQLLPNAAQAVESQELVEVFPNPFQESFTLKTTLQGEGQVAVFNLLGEKIWQSEVRSGEAVIATSGWKVGAYLLVSQTANGTVARKILKM